MGIVVASITLILMHKANVAEFLQFVCVGTVETEQALLGA